MDNSAAARIAAQSGDEADASRDAQLGTCVHHEDVTDMVAFPIAMGFAACRRRWPDLRSLLVELGGESMITTASERSPRFYARVAGFIHLAAMALSMFSQVYVPGRIIVSGDAAATAHNLAASGGLFRAGIVVDILIFVSDIVIAWAFYELLSLVDGGLARLGAFIRVAAAAVMAAVTLNGLVSVRLLSGVDYLRPIGSQHLQGFARLFMSMRGIGLHIGFVFLGAGSTIFAYLLFRSRYVPRVLAGWGMFASPLLALGSLATLLNPWFAANASMAFMVPMFFYEVPLGLWLLAKGVRLPAPYSTAR
jgi:hypothetical protein